MKFSAVLSLAALGSALMLPAEDDLNQVLLQDHQFDAEHEDALSSSFRGFLESAAGSSSPSVEFADAIDWAHDLEDAGVLDAEDYAPEAWLDADLYEEAMESDDDDDDDDDKDDKDGHHGRPGHGHRPGHGRGRHGRHGRHPHHGPSNLTVYQLIAKSNYTTKLAELINKYDDLVEALNSTSANFTVFAPTDRAFEKIPEHAPEPTEQQLKDILSYHVVPDFYPAKRVLFAQTAPTLLKSASLGSEPKPQRLALKTGLKGLTVNFYSRIFAVNIFASNGVIHGVDHIILPPPKAVTAIQLFPGQFSTLELALTKTGLLEKLNSTDHPGGTLFAPSNLAFRKLGPRINAFLFSPHGQKYLEALLKYHVVPGNTLYSDAYYSADKDDSEAALTGGLFHVDLPTLLDDRTLSVDIARFGLFVTVKVNAFTRIVVTDGVVKDGVIHVPSNVLIPPKTVGGKLEMYESDGEGDEEGYMSVEELVDRLAPFVKH